MNGSARTILQGEIDHVRQHLDVLVETLGTREMYLSAVLLKHLQGAVKRIRDRIGM